MHISGSVDTREVFVDGVQLYPNYSLKVINHSPDGFLWGYGGSAPAQLALALLLLRTDEDTASYLHQDFKWEFIARADQDKNLSLDIDIDRWIKERARGVGKTEVDIIKPNPEALGSYERKLTCTKGHETQCLYAHSDKCECDCQGQNHGKLANK